MVSPRDFMMSDNNSIFTSRPESRVPNSSFSTQLKALLVRNVTIKRRERRKTLSEILIPLYFILVLALVRMIVKDTTFDAVDHTVGHAAVKESFVQFHGEEIHVAPDTDEVSTA
ncbi:uncharacterized protein LOC143022000 isoform X2 [Oratosquilla oratoria]|uniref:uncharacterized protein LOC143022000 isoform X2 n=1 Tax=Oratosquilla oratoria TaxID=337810 RepID=UPI003F7688BF